MRGGAFFARDFRTLGAAGAFARAALFFGGAAAGASPAFSSCSALSACLRNSRRSRMRPAMTAYFLVRRGAIRGEAKGIMVGILAGPRRKNVLLRMLDDCQIRREGSGEKQDTRDEEQPRHCTPPDAKWPPTFGG